MSNIQVGDTVTWEGVVTDTSPLGAVSVRFGTNDYSYALGTDEVTFVSRPEKTYTLELTAYELTQLRDGCWSSADDKINAILDAI